MKDLKFTVSKDVLKLGVKIVTLLIAEIKNTKSSNELDDYLTKELHTLSNHLNEINYNYKEDKVLMGFRDLHTKVGRSNRDYPASPEVLVRRFIDKGYFPRINSVVDIYNLISLKTRLALGAHDLNYVQGNISLRLTNGKEKFLPLGSKDPVSVFPGEYAYIDDEENIICRLEVLQVEPTKITLNSQDTFFIIQGNSNTENAYIQNAVKELISLINRFCGGEVTILNSLN